MLHKRQSFGARKVSPPQPTCMTDEQKSAYLTDLRNNRPARPGGARPLPSRPAATRATQIENAHVFEVNAVSEDNSGNKAESKRSSISNPKSTISVGSLKGRPLVQAPSAPPPLRVGNSNRGQLQQSTHASRDESVTRELERQEAHDLREALEQIDFDNEETSIYAAAQQEAADLVWKHLNPRRAQEEKLAAYKNPDLDKRKKHSVEEAEAVRRRHDRTTLQSSVKTNVEEDDEQQIGSFKSSKREPRNGSDSQDKTSTFANRRQSGGKRNVSSGSSKGVFRNPEDQIYEEPEVLETLGVKQEHRPELPLQPRMRNSLPQGSRPLPDKPYTIPPLERSKLERFEIYKNPPSQSRNAEYTSNPTVQREATPEVDTPKGRAMEIRSDEIRAATSMKRKDRSPKLPTPTAVSDRPGRPIVSFDPAWRRDTGSSEASLDLERSPSRQALPLTTTRSAPAVPTINLPDEDIPSIQVSDASVSALPPAVSVNPPVPTISLPEENSSHQPPALPRDVPEGLSTRPLPQISVDPNPKPAPRPLPAHTKSLPIGLSNDRTKPNRVPWLSRTPTTTGATATCNACQLPIAGRIVTASGSAPGGPKARFHPECFTCFHCSTALECVSFYPEPQASHDDRIRQDAESDPREMRFYCHLDYHDLFSPRCASCKTPIEGAVILAAGKSWHEGHFFCAECGDPFSSSSPFVEDKGYAYCVACHTKRTSARCRACKRQILDEICVEALGGKWHKDCFCCDECHGDFGDDGRFFIREIEIELTEKEKRRGIVSRKFEDRAVCQRCEELRLRRHGSFL